MRSILRRASARFAAAGWMARRVTVVPTPYARPAASGDVLIAVPLERTLTEPELAGLRWPRGPSDGKSPLHRPIGGGPRAQDKANRGGRRSHRSPRPVAAGLFAHGECQPGRGRLVRSRTTTFHVLLSPFNYTDLGAPGPSAADVIVFHDQLQQGDKTVDDEIGSCTLVDPFDALANSTGVGPAWKGDHYVLLRECSTATEGPCPDRWLGALPNRSR